MKWNLFCAFSFTILSLNVRGLGNEVKRKLIFEYYRNRADIILFQETHSTNNCEKIWTAQWGGPILFSHGESTSRGVAILFKKSGQFNITNILRDFDGRFLACDIKTINGLEFALCNIYGPNQDKPAFYLALSQNIADLHPRKVIMGDFNVTLNSNLDRLNSTEASNNKKCKQALLQLMQEYTLEEVWRSRNPAETRYSWFRGNTQASRIDYALITKSLEQICENTLYLQGIQTDHSAFIIVLKDLIHERGKGYWKANVSLLQDEKIVEYVKAQLQSDLNRSENLPPLQRWYKLKKDLTKHLQRISRQQANERHETVANLSEVIARYEEQFPLCRMDQQLFEKSKMDLNDILTEKARGSLFRSKVKWAEGGERVSKYFLNLEKIRASNKTCSFLFRDNAPPATSMPDVLHEQHKFYSKLYQSDPNILFEVENTSNIKLSEDIASNLNVPLTVKELTDAVMKLAKEKSPGPDGLPAEIYQAFWNELKNPFMDMMQEAFEKDYLEGSIMEGVLNLIPKQNKDSRYLKNLRPITLLNSDYKIIEKAIAQRIQNVLDRIIDYDQVGFMKKRRAAQCVRKLIDLINFCKTSGLDSFLLCLDYQKAFDRPELTSILKSLAFFNFPQVIQQWIGILYRGFSVKIQNNGYFTDKVDIQRSVHQGGCASAFLYIILAETLAIQIRNNIDIKGISTGDFTHKLNQFADDTSAFGHATQQTIDALFDTLDQFHFHSGLLINYEKTVLYRISSLENLPELYTQKQVSWVTEDVRVLGIDILNSPQQNYQPIIDRIKIILKQWAHRDLSLYGKITVINTLAASLFVHKMQVLPKIPEDIVHQAESLFKHFIWNGRKNKVPIETLMKKKSEGGVNLVDLNRRDDALKIGWIQILEQDKKCAELAFHLFSPILKQNIFRCNLHEGDVRDLKISSPFWRDMLIAWCKYNFKRTTCPEGQTIWYNSHIKIGEQVVLYEKPYQCGLLWVSQLYENNRLIGIRTAQEKYKLNFVEYQGVIAALPKEWRKYLVTDECENNTCYDADINRHALTKHAYAHLPTRKSTSAPEVKWLKNFEHYFIQEDVSKQFNNINAVSNNPKLRSFQYRLLHGALITNIHLQHWMNAVTSACSFCGEERETIQHLLYDCKYSQTIWHSISELATHYCSRVLNFSYENVFFNSVCQMKTCVVNAICLISKQYLYRTRCLGQLPQANELKLVVKKTESIEKYIAIKNSKVRTHNKKWNRS